MSFNRCISFTCHTDQLRSIDARVSVNKQVCFCHSFTKTCKNPFYALTYTLIYSLVYTLIYSLTTHIRPQWCLKPNRQAHKVLNKIILWQPAKLTCRWPPKKADAEAPAFCLFLELPRNYITPVIYSGRYTSPSFSSTSFVCRTYGVLRYCPNFLIHFWIDVSV